MQQASAIVLGLILGGMMAFDMGGPVSKAAYTFAVGLLATFLFKARFTPEEREAGGAAAVLGLAFITEGAIPYAARDPLRVIPALVAGSAAAGAISMVANCRLLVPHGGIFAVAIPGAVANWPMYLAAIVVGTLVTTTVLYILKRPIPAVVDRETPQSEEAEMKEAA